MGYSGSTSVILAQSNGHPTNAYVPVFPGCSGGRRHSAPPLTLRPAQGDPQVHLLIKQGRAHQLQYRYVVQRVNIAARKWSFLVRSTFGIPIFPRIFLLQTFLKTFIGLFEKNLVIFRNVTFFEYLKLLVCTYFGMVIKCDFVYFERLL